MLRLHDQAMACPDRSSGARFTDFAIYE